MNIKGALKIAGAYTAAIIGAGFASGREIISYFVRFGKWGIGGVVIACIVFSLFAYGILSVCRRYNFTGYSKFIDYATGKGVMGKIFKVIIIVVSFISLATMIACAGEIGETVLHMPTIISSVVFAFVCGFILLMKNSEIESINAILGMVIGAGVIFVCLYILRFREHQTMALYSRAALSGISYAGYNIVGTGAILSGMSGEAKSKNDALSASVSSGIILFLVISLMYGVLSVYYGKINLGNIPMLTLTLRENNILGVLYGIFLTMAVLTTAVSSGYALGDMIPVIRSRGRNTVYMIFGAFIISGIGFATLVDTVYRLLGYAGAILSAVMFIMIYLKSEEK